MNTLIVISIILMLWSIVMYTIFLPHNTMDEEDFYQQEANLSETKKIINHGLHHSK